MLSENIPTLTKTSISPCPCGRGDMSDLERIPRGSLIKTFLFWLPIKRYRCYKCMNNRWLLGRNAK
jgi:hypothetical protein